jgi:uncharacterized RDD family membrane protein YckC
LVKPAAWRTLRLRLVYDLRRSWQGQGPRPKQLERKAGSAMSDVSQGPGWWQASDGKWYAPEQASGGQAFSQPTPSYSTPGTMGSAAAGGLGGQQLAEFGPRAIGFLIDYVAPLVLVIVGVIVAIILSAIWWVLGIIGWIIAFVCWVAAIAMWISYSFQVGKTGQSPGMRMQGIRCISEETGQPIGGGMGIVRYFAHIVDGLICYIGWLFPLWDAKKQTLADKIMKTVVVTGAPKEEFNVEMFKPKF